MYKNSLNEPVWCNSRDKEKWRHNLNESKPGSIPGCPIDQVSVETLVPHLADLRSTGGRVRRMVIPLSLLLKDCRTFKMMGTDTTMVGTSVPGMEQRKCYSPV